MMPNLWNKDSRINAQLTAHLKYCYAHFPKSFVRLSQFFLLIICLRTIRIIDYVCGFIVGPACSRGRVCDILPDLADISPYQVRYLIGNYEGTHTLLSSSASIATKDYTNSFGSTFSTTNVKCVPGQMWNNLGVIDFEINSTSDLNLGYDLTISTTTTTTYTVSVDMYRSMTVKSWKMAYFCYDWSIITFISTNPSAQTYTSTAAVTTGSGIRSSKTVINFATGAINTSHAVYIMPYVSGADIVRASTSDSFYVKITLQIINSTSYYRIHWTGQNNKLWYACQYRITYDQTEVQATQETYLDAQFLIGSNGVTNPYSLVFSDLTNYFSGMNHLYFLPGQLVKFTYNMTSYSLTSPGYSFMNFSTINYRYRSCVAPTIYFMEIENLCYDVCPPGYFPNTVYDYCEACFPGCLSCTGTASNQCNTCNTTANRTLSGTSCPCVTTFYHSGVIQCGSCSPSCLGCTGTATNCTSCPTGAFRVQSGTACPCQSGYVDVGTTVCATCASVLSGCTTCTNTTTCTACNASLYMTINSTSKLCLCTSGNFREMNGGACECITGYVDVGVAVCATCASRINGCIACQNTTACTECNATLNFVVNGTSCVCAIGYVLNGTTCVPCGNYIAGCTDCSSQTVCRDCNLTLNWQIVGTTCGCVDGYAKSGSTCATCSTLIYGCNICQNTTACTDCNSALNTVLSGTSCVCDVGFAMNNSQCVACGSLITGCDECSSSSVCTNCDSSQLMTLNGSSCKCVDGFILQSGACILCSGLMAGCTNCSSVSTCTACNTNLNMVLNGSKCACATGYTMYSNICTSCSVLLYGCTACTSSSQCTACDSSMNTVINGSSCSCATGYALSGGVCVQCSEAIEGCQMCSSASVCTSCQAGYVLQNSMCAGCGDVINGCTSCTSASNCTACDATLHMYLSGGICVCDSGYALDPNNCSPCSQLINNCTQCSSATSCSSCTSGFFVNHIGSCSACNTSIPGCVQCSSNTTCLECDSANRYTLSASKRCVCQSGYYFNILTGLCASCPELMPNCQSCNASNYCTQCTSPLTWTGGRCQCPSAAQYYDQSTTLCVDCPTQCLTCKNSTACLTCDKNKNRVLNSSQCVCKVNFEEDSSGNCVSMSTCVTGFYLDNGVCKEICGDGILFELECDDGNLAAGDGCSAACTVETNFTCKDGSPTSASKCSYNKPFELELVEAKKDIYANAVNFTIKIWPPLSLLENFNFNQIMSSSLPMEEITAVYKDGYIYVRVVYKESIQNSSAAVTVNPPTSYDNTFAMKASQTTFVVDPSNTEAYYYSDASYQSAERAAIITKISASLGVGMTIVGLGFWKLIGVEMMNMLQFMFFSVSLLTTLQPVLAPITELSSSINGYNRMFWDSPDLYDFDQPYMGKILTQMGVGARFLQNCNYMLVIQGAVILIGGIVFGLSRLYDTVQQLFLTVAKFFLNEVLMVVGLYNAMNVGFSLGIHGKFWSEPDPQPAVSHVVNLAPALVCILMFAMNCVLMVKKPELFEHNNQLFKHDQWARYHPIILYVYRMLAGLVMAAVNGWQYGLFPVLGLQVAFLSYVTFKRPYRKTVVTVRAIINEAIICLVLSTGLLYNFYITNEMIATSDWGELLHAPAWSSVGLVAGAMVLNTGCVIYSIYKACMKSKTAEIHPKADSGATDLKQSSKLKEDFSDSAHQSSTQLNLNSSDLSPKRPKKILKRQKNPESLRQDSPLSPELRRQGEMEDVQPLVL